MSVAEETHRIFLELEEILRFMRVEDVTPFLRILEVCVYYGKCLYPLDEVQAGEINLIFFGQDLFMPFNSDPCSGVESTDVSGTYCAGIVVADNAGTIQLAYKFDTLVGICAIAGDVAQADMLVDLVILDILEDGFQRLKVCVYVTDDSVFHA